MRLFVAVDLDAAARAAVAGEQHRIRAAAAGGSPGGFVRWVKPEHLHITLVFLGEVSEPPLNAVIAAYAEPASLAAFDLVFEGIGAFPPRGSPRALWIGVGDGVEQLLELQRAMEARARALGLQIDARPFSPHLTIGRWKESRPSDRRRLVADGAGRGAPVARVRVGRATLYESRLGSSGPTYIPRAHVTLAPR